MPNSALETLVGNMSLNDLASRSGRSIEDLVAFAFNGTSARRGRSASSSANGSAGARRSKNVDTRTASGREAYEAAVFGVIQNARDWTSAVNIRSQVGGTPQQARAALNRLISDGKVKFKGQARATKYAIA